MAKLTIFKGSRILLSILLISAFALGLNSCNNASKKKEKSETEVKDTQPTNNTGKTVDTTKTSDTTGKGEQVPPPPK